jgi:thioredoxin-related protein
MQRFFILALLMLSATTQAALFEVSSADLAREAAVASREAKLLAVLFEQDECGACLTMRRNVFRGSTTERSFGSTFRTVSVNVSNTAEVVTPDGKKEQLIAWTRHLRVFGTPALAFFGRDGQLLYRHVGPVANGTELIELGAYVVCGAVNHQPFDLYRQSSKRPRKPTAPQLLESCHASN